ncbi:unnamed protein product [Schistocephalus solidus]|uniref:Secreted protein n=1 Tax=Schistocephalus solidus TaxID=70667 RepID=A0A183T9L8_SCHSO|nr:unnamed protein product [Schistocephalus solidus]
MAIPVSLVFVGNIRLPLLQLATVRLLALLESGPQERAEQATTICVADEDIKEGKLVVFFFLQHKLDVREYAVEVFFECQHLTPFDDDESVIHISIPEFRSVVLEDQ